MWLPVTAHDEMLGYKYDQCSRYHIFALKKTRASGRNVGKVFNPVVKLVLENQPFLMPEPAEKPSLHICKYFTFTNYALLFGCVDHTCQEITFYILMLAMFIVYVLNYTVIVQCICIKQLLGFSQ